MQNNRQSGDGSVNQGHWKVTKIVSSLVLAFVHKNFIWLINLIEWDSDKAEIEK